ncbi:MAG: lipoyl(octanoyl) transferase LipB [Rhodovibrio sp.]|nr:lipoyl(octanoyl) transferase LipB [Rhodovibrio sp.]
MEDRVAGIRAGSAGELIWLLQHPPLYTAGTSANPADLVDAGGFPTTRPAAAGSTPITARQAVAYTMLDLKARDLDVRTFVWSLEEWVIRALAQFNVRGERRQGRVGIWVPLDGGREAKIAAIGVRVRRLVSFHGIALNVDPQSSHFAGIVPCGIREHGVTSLAELGYPSAWRTSTWRCRARSRRCSGSGKLPRRAALA